MTKATSYASDVTDQTLPNAASGTVVIGATTYTLPFRIIFLSTLSTASTQGTEWSTSGGYTSSSAGGATGGVALNGLVATAAASGTKANTSAITITNAPATTWADNEVHDSTGTTQKRVVFKGSPSLGKTVNSGDTVTIAIGGLTSTDS